jgi:hypothetical protein
MFTVTRLGGPGGVDDRDRLRPRGDVKRWQPGNMRLPWAAAGMLEAAKQFRRVKGYHQLPQLPSAIKEATSNAEGSTVPVAPAA